MTREGRTQAVCAPVTSSALSQNYWISESQTISTDLSTGSTSVMAMTTRADSGSGSDKTVELPKLLSGRKMKRNKKQERTSTPVDMPVTAAQALDMCKLLRNYKESGSTTTSSRTIVKNGQDRRYSTGTLNRLILVVQALEAEAEFRRRTDVSGSLIVIALRTINLLMLLAIDGLILSGVGQYYSNFGGKRSLTLTPDKWYYNIQSKLPLTFSEMRLNGQYFATFIITGLFLITLFMHIVHICWSKYSRLLCMCYSFGAVPFSLFVFGLEMHYSTCPWIDDFYRSEILRRDFNSVEPYFDTQCGISGWALAGIFSLLSCSLYISEGLVSAFFRSQSTRRRSKMNAFL